MSVGNEQPRDDALPSQLRAEVSRFRELRERGERVKEELAATEATVRGATGAATVTVGAGGVLRALEISDAMRKLTPAKLTEEIMKAYLQAGRQAAEQSVAIMSTLVGPDSPTLQMMRDAIPPDPSAEDER